MLCVIVSPRLRVNCGGIMDILALSAQAQPSVSQQDDLVAVGQLLLSVTLQSPMAAIPNNYRQSLDTLASHYSPDLHHITQ